MRIDTVLADRAYGNSTGDEILDRLAINGRVIPRQGRADPVQPMCLIADRQLRTKAEGGFEWRDGPRKTSTPVFLGNRRNKSGGASA